MVLIQKWPFFQLVFSGNIGEENVFYDIVERKTAFLGNKNKNFKKDEKLTFFQTHGFCPKLPFFQLFFFGNIGQENVLYDILERINAFLGYKNKKFKKLKN